MNSKIIALTLIGSPQAVFLHLKNNHHTHISLLESAQPTPANNMPNWSYIACTPLATLKSLDKGAGLYMATANTEPSCTWHNPFEALREVLAMVTAVVNQPNQVDEENILSIPAGLNFTAGLVGYLGYDLVRYIEKLPTLAVDDVGLPDLHLYLCDHVLAYDHTQQQWYFCTTVLLGSDAVARAKVWERTLQTVNSLQVSQRGGTTPSTGFIAGVALCKTPATQYLHQVQTVLEFVRAGDILQANLTHRLESSFTGDSFALYQALTRANPAPYAAYLEGDGFAIASMSPEQFLQVRNRRIVARPIKGTRLRHAEPEQDLIARAALQASEKDRTENVMIVDLMRNDLGRVAKTGSVKVPALFEIEAHPSVWQMVSTVTAELRDDADVVDMLRACWPPGSMTGAPKVRAMEIIDSLEPVRRGVYSGAIGYFDISGAIDLSVVIRTAVVTQNRVMVQVGGAIVTDSEPASELDETYAKGKKLFETLGWQ